MSHPRPFRPRRSYSPKIESPWAKAWRQSPERMADHIKKLNVARLAKSDEKAQLVQAVFNLMPADPVFPYQLRDALAREWKLCYEEDVEPKAAWNLVRLAMRKGMVGRSDDGRIYPRHG
jgi:hypothetical protein